jgi:hypothetical protein
MLRLVPTIRVTKKEGGPRHGERDAFLVEADRVGVGAGLTRDAVEALFQRLASRALVMPVATAELPHGREVAAALLILRECMRHLGFDRVEAAAAPDAANATA